MTNEKSSEDLLFYTGDGAALVSTVSRYTHIAEDKKSGAEAQEIFGALKDEIPEYTEPETTMPIAEEYDLFA